MSAPRQGGSLNSNRWGQPKRPAHDNELAESCHAVVISGQSSEPVPIAASVRDCARRQ
jgi:hypothetical protein